MHKSPFFLLCAYKSYKKDTDVLNLVKKRGTELVRGLGEAERTEILLFFHFRGQYRTNNGDH